MKYNNSYNVFKSPSHPVLFKKRAGLSLTGFTYIEIIAGITIIAFVLIGMNGIFGVGIRNNKKAESINIALGLAQELMEQAKSKDFDGIINIPESVSGEFKKRLNVTPNYQNDANKKLVAATVSGPDITDVVLNCVVTNPVL